MSVGDSAEEFISIHALGRERLLVLACGLPSHPLKLCFSPEIDDKEFCLNFLTTSRQMCFYQKPDRRPPQITGLRVSAAHQGGSDLLANSPRSEFKTLLLISSNKVCRYISRY